MLDSNGNLIKEGDIVRIYPISYDEDGSYCVGCDCIQDKVILNENTLKLNEHNINICDLTDVCCKIYVI